MLSVSIECSANVLERRACERAHVEAQTKEVRVEERGQKRVAQEEGAEKDARKDGYFGVGDEFHRRVVVCLDPCRR